MARVDTNSYTRRDSSPEGARRKKKNVLKGTSISPELRQLEDVVGRFIEYWGFKRIHGRIWAHVFTSARPMDSMELMERLGVSKGLMSIAIRELLEHEVIKVANTGRHGRVFYEANSDLVGVISKVLRSREILMLGHARLATDGLLKLKPNEVEAMALSRERLIFLLNLTSSAQTLLSAFLDRGENSQGALFESLFAKATI